MILIVDLILNWNLIDLYCWSTSFPSQALEPRFDVRTYTLFWLGVSFIIIALFYLDKFSSFGSLVISYGLGRDDILGTYLGNRQLFGTSSNVNKQVKFPRSFYLVLCSAHFIILSITIVSIFMFLFDSEVIYHFNPYQYILFILYFVCLMLLILCVLLLDVLESFVGNLRVSCYEFLHPLCT